MLLCLSDLAEQELHGSRGAPGQGRSGGREEEDRRRGGGEEGQRRGRGGGEEGHRRRRGGGEEEEWRRRGGGEEEERRSRGLTKGGGQGGFSAIARDASDGRADWASSRGEAEARSSRGGGKGAKENPLPLPLRSRGDGAEGMGVAVERKRIPCPCQGGEGVKEEGSGARSEGGEEWSKGVMEHSTVVEGLSAADGFSSHPAGDGRVGSAEEEMRSRGATAQLRRGGAAAEVERRSEGAKEHDRAQVKRSGGAKGMRSSNIRRRVVMLRWRWSGAAALEVEWCCYVRGGVVLLPWRWSGAAALEVEWVPSDGSHLTAVLGCNVRSSAPSGQEEPPMDSFQYMGIKMDLAKENKSLKAELEKVRAALAKSESTCLALQKDLAGIDDSYQKRLGKQAERLALCQNELEKYQMKVEKLQREKKDIEESISVSSQQDTSASVVRPSEDQTASDADSSQAKGQENEQLDEHDSSNESSESRHALGNIGKCSTDGSSVEKEVTAVSTPETDQFSLGTAGLDSGVIDNIPDSNLKSELSAPRQLQLETALEATRKENSELRAQLEEKDMELARVRETATWQDMEMTKLRGMVKDLSLPDSALKVSETDPKALVVANEKINELEKKVSELASAKKRPKFLKFLCMS
ncbi:unnamed protein product [Closterium sp. Naga37s-1]|nr:unnamed protein product [Closterium sp. Naga37s-1]